MKKGLCVFAIVAFIAAMSTSCKKDCMCTSTMSGMMTGSTTENIGKMSKDECTSNSGTVSMWDGMVQVSVSCKQ